MKTIITAAALLIASSTAVQAEWDMPFFGDGNNSSNGAFIGNGLGDTAGNGAHKGNGSADGEGEFSFSMSFKGRGSSKMDSNTSSDWKGNGKTNFNADSTTASNSQANSNYAPYGYNPYNVQTAPVAAPQAQVQAPAAK